MAMEIKHFLDNLASSAPTPGGGSASALAGSLSASLIAMVAGLSCKKGQTLNREMREIKRKALVIQEKLFRAIDEDARSFDAVMEAFRLSREGGKERLYRSRMIQKAYQKATVTPQKVCELSIPLMEFAEFLLREGNPNAISDTGVAAYMAGAALGGGVLNIRINLGSIKDKAFREGKERLIRQLLKRQDRLLKAIESYLMQG
jgi:formiminotetrahydrofolate cyclodeaminase